jgi:molecular chaperone HtpG
VLRDSPARLVSDDAAGREMQRIQQLLGRESEEQPRILELNPGHPLVAALARRAEASADDPVVTAAVEQLYDNALLQEGLHQNPAAMVPRLLKLMEAAARGLDREGTLDRETREKPRKTRTRKREATKGEDAKGDASAE